MNIKSIIASFFIFINDFQLGGKITFSWVLLHRKYLGRMLISLAV
jgi:hypothetical protein